MVNRLSYNSQINPAMLTDGFLWFKDLTVPDPYGILPFVAGGINLLNLMNTPQNSTSSLFRNLRKYMYILPIISIPVWMTFPVAFNLYWIANSLVQFVILAAFRRDNFRRWMGVPDFLPGSKLEREALRRGQISLKENMSQVTNKVKILNNKPKVKSAGLKNKASTVVRDKY